MLLVTGRDFTVRPKNNERLAGMPAPRRKAEITLASDGIARGYSVGNFSKTGGPLVAERDGSSGIISFKVRKGWKGTWTIFGTK